jgi:hypothetical protein
MPVEVTDRYFDPDDRDGDLAQLASGRAAPVTADSPWVEPDYASIPGDADIPMTEAERVLVWPGPALIMPAGLLPDGKPHSYNERENASRICGSEVTNNAEADAVVRAYIRQQNALRDRAGLARARSGSSGQLEDLPDTVAAIKQLHRDELARRIREGHR